MGAESDDECVDEYEDDMGDEDDSADDDMTDPLAHIVESDAGAGGSSSKWMEKFRKITKG